ncbi:YdaU family protein [Rubrivivax gelatinosus]|uniref:Uncharacterized protein YdaU (DUF1376 family) n=1 Tax=Rubrivivax gelatinosus TaxID=28068 RepID=A0A4R2MD45_RUBGE|nr:YdaU family protein [Rubrivivax gelatinosus]MBK1688897.1 hypothetical protein [Rubrivivax gelatinosus]TCP03065.1 uncharacterized protein YdaU (DUF1376 family) [Rubrivivax gelatinosus]
MNFYKHHIGDYAQATAHLSFVEDAAYARMLRKYYAEEKPLPADLKAVQRLVGARTREERDAVEQVLSEFFYLDGDGWHNKRADAELARASAQAETNRRIAEEREAKRRARRAPNEPSTKRAATEHEPLHESLACREPSQTPDARHQTPEEEEEKEERIERMRAQAEADGVEPTSAGLACRVIRAAGVQDVNPSHPDLAKLLAAGATPEELGDVAREAVAKGKPRFAWVLATAAGRRRDAADSPAIPIKPSSNASGPPGADFLNRARAAAGLKPEEPEDQTIEMPA